MSGLGGSSWIVLSIAGLWLAIAAALLVIAARRMRDASALIGSARSLASLLEVAPARPLLVRSDGSLEADVRLARELGLERQPRAWDELAGYDHGLVEDDVQALREAVAGAALSGSAVQAQVRVAGSDRIFEVRGGPAPVSEGAGAMLLWFSDTSASEAERSKLAQRIHQTESALDSLTHLIEAW